MKSALLILGMTLLVFSSCTTAYKTGQTPDDVYYSPVRAQDEYQTSQKNDDRQYRNNDDYYSDRYLRMKVADRTRWSDLDDWYYNDYRYRRYYPYYNDWNAYSYWNSYYNPYYNNYVIVNPKTVNTYNKPRTVNLNTYTPTNPARTNSNAKTGYTGRSSNDDYYTTPKNSSSNNNNGGSVLRNIFNGSNSSSSNNNSGSSNNNTSSGNSGSSNTSSGSSSAPVRRF
ncbi:MAG: hypothetical protein JST23_11005 [Bacteroidetes bacterium]|nr:hypothetical protein [Bacteroidota bacterium]